VAEMTVKTVYKKETGKSYTILSQSGSEIIRRLVLGTVLDNEKRLNLPGNREGAWLTSANYEMKLKPGGIQLLDVTALSLAFLPNGRPPISSRERSGWTRRTIRSFRFREPRPRAPRCSPDPRR
jgi:hypothetical protein